VIDIEHAVICFIFNHLSSYFLYILSHNLYQYVYKQDNEYNEERKEDWKIYVKEQTVIREAIKSKNH